MIQAINYILAACGTLVKNLLVSLKFVFKKYEPGTGIRIFTDNVSITRYFKWKMLYIKRYTYNMKKPAKYQAGRCCLQVEKLLANLIFTLLVGAKCHLSSTSIAEVSHESP
jgi:hypothetical protein